MNFTSALLHVWHIGLARTSRSNTVTVRHCEVTELAHDDNTFVIGHVLQVADFHDAPLSAGVAVEAVLTT